MRPSLVPTLAFLTWYFTTTIAAPIPPSLFRGVSFHQTIPSGHAHKHSPPQSSIFSKRTMSLDPEPNSHPGPEHLSFYNHVRQFHSAHYGSGGQPSPIEDTPTETTATPTTQMIMPTLAHAPSPMASSLLSPTNTMLEAYNYPRESRQPQAEAYISAHHIGNGDTESGKERGPLEANIESRGVLDGVPDASNKVDNIKSQVQSAQAGTPTVIPRGMPVDMCGEVTPDHVVPKNMPEPGRENVNIGKC